MTNADRGSAFLLKQNRAYHSHVCPILPFIIARARRLELLERLDGLTGAGKHTEDVEADLSSC
jgi:hypothetical protein